ncbi:CynX/NimT family MFS transporter [Bradyrhizobium sp.]|uniref:MFS transporter n=1 Tax=Bradyrhizobium sp. TaxID=376 RepID=UPI00272332B8|nr:MFS transporter [Bradyrhizobium sp.]MDO9294542.1 MFS transporter [Bradyrhizobium sp.]
MGNRWGILAVLFAVRSTIAFQFQSVAAVAPLLTSQFGVSLADIGVLIGLYFAPGVVLALPGGAIGQRFGDKRTALGALLLMLAGSAMMAASASWHIQIAGRLISGAGSVILSVQVTKMLTDWFAGKEIATAMALLVNSWPLGTAVCLLALPWIGTHYGVGAAHLGVAAFAAGGLVLLAILYQPPADVAVASTTAPQRLDRNATLAVIAAGLTWGLFNVGFAVIVSFGPSMLVERGWSIAEAGSTISIALWVSVVSVPLGGLLADRTGRPATIVVASALLSAVLMVLLPRSGAVLPVVFALGLISGLPAGPIMSLPARVLQPQTRAIGMGVFFTMFFACMMLGPVVGGACAKWAGSAAAAFDFGAAMILLCPLILWGFNRIPLPLAKAA